MGTTLGPVEPARRFNMAKASKQRSSEKQPQHPKPKNKPGRRDRLTPVQRAYVAAMHAVHAMGQLAGKVPARDPYDRVIDRGMKAQRAIKAMARSLGIDTKAPPFDDPVAWYVVTGRSADDAKE
jgi:hypothetical protein